MSLLFNGATAKVEFGTGTSPHNEAAITVMYVWRANTIDTTFRYLLRLTGGSAGQFNCTLNSSSELEMERQYATTNALAITSGLSLSTGVWYRTFVVDAGAGSAPRIYHGPLGQDISEPSYGTQTTPAGALTDASSRTWSVGFRDATRRFVGDIAVQAVYNAALSIGQCRAQMQRPHGANLIGYNLMGFSGASSQVDYSGTAFTGTITAATVSDHAPLVMPFGFMEGEIPFTVASGDTNVAAGTAALSVATYSASVALHKNVSAATATLSLATLSAGVALHRNVAATTTTLSVATHTATVNSETNVQAGTGTLSLATLAADINLNVSVSAGTATLTVTTYSATVNAETNVTAATAALTLATFSATIIASQPARVLLPPNIADAAARTWKTTAPLRGWRVDAAERTWKTDA